MRKIVVPLAVLALTIAGPAYAGPSKAKPINAKSGAKSTALVSKSPAKPTVAVAKTTTASAKTKRGGAASAKSPTPPTPKGSAIVGTAPVATAAPAIVISTACQGSDISPGANACAGFVSGNIINSGGGPGDPANPFSANEEQMAQLLAQLGFTYTGDSNGLEQIFANGSTNIMFNTLLGGSTIIGVHYGNGQNSPGGQGSGDDTAFYRFDADLLANNSFTLNFGASSTVTLFQTSSSPVPEPGTWAMMLLGFGFVGAASRRRRRNAKLTQLA